MNDNIDNELSEEMPIVDLSFGAAARAALQGLDDVDLEAEFCSRACVMKSGVIDFGQFPLRPIKFRPILGC